MQYVLDFKSFKLLQRTIFTFLGSHAQLNIRIFLFSILTPYERTYQLWLNAQLIGNEDVITHPRYSISCCYPEIR